MVEEITCKPFPHYQHPLMPHWHHAPCSGAVHLAPMPGQHFSYGKEKGKTDCDTDSMHSLTSCFPNYMSCECEVNYLPDVISDVA